MKAIGRIALQLVNSPKLVLVCIVVDWTICSAVYGLVEKRGLVASLWWTVVTSFTVGYGDMYPSTSIGRIDAFIVMASGWIFLSAMLAHIMTVVMPDPNIFTEEEQSLIKDGITGVLALAKKAVRLLYAVIGKLGKIVIDLQEIKRNQAVIMRNLELLLEQQGIEPHRLSAIRDQTELVKK